VDVKFIFHKPTPLDATTKMEINTDATNRRRREKDFMIFRNLFDIFGSTPQGA
jgi:hypothetical protein